MKAKKIKKEEKHPEQKRGEVFVSNVTKHSYNSIGFKSKRLGTKAYDMDGKILRGEGIFPVFAKKSEVDRVRSRKSPSKADLKRYAESRRALYMQVREPLKIGHISMDMWGLD